MRIVARYGINTRLPTAVKMNTKLDYNQMPVNPKETRADLCLDQLSDLHEKNLILEILNLLMMLPLLLLFNSATRSMRSSIGAAVISSAAMLFTICYIFKRWLCRKKNNHVVMLQKCETTLVRKDEIRFFNDNGEGGNE